MKNQFDLLNDWHNELSATCSDSILRAELACKRAEEAVKKYRLLKNYNQQLEPIVTVRVKGGRVDVKVFNFASACNLKNRHSEG